MKSHLQSRPDRCVNYTVAQDLVLSAVFCVMIYCHLLKILNLCTKSLIFSPTGPQQLCRESWPYISFFRKRMAHFPCLLNLQTYQHSGSFTAWPHMLPQTCKTMAQLNRPLFFHFLIHLANLIKHDPSHTRMHSIHMPTSPIVSLTAPANQVNLHPLKPPLKCSALCHFLLCFFCSVTLSSNYWHGMAYFLFQAHKLHHSRLFWNFVHKLCCKILFNYFLIILKMIMKIIMVGIRCCMSSIQLSEMSIVPSQHLLKCILISWVCSWRDNSFEAGTYFSVQGLDPGTSPPGARG